MDRKLALLLYGGSLLLIGLSYLFWRHEKEKTRKFFLSSSWEEPTFFVVSLIRGHAQRLSQMGWHITKKQLVLAWMGFTIVASAIPLLFGDAWVISILFGLLALTGIHFALRIYGLRFALRLEKGLRESALPIGIESLEATGNTAQAIGDILRLSRDPVVIQEFLRVRALMNTLMISGEEAMGERARALSIKSYEWLATYTLHMQRYGAHTAQAWQDVADELEDRQIFRAKVLTKTASIRYGAYIFAGSLFVIVLLFYPAFAFLMTGWMPIFFIGTMLSVLFGVYRLARLGGDVK